MTAGDPGVTEEPSEQNRAIRHEPREGASVTSPPDKSEQEDRECVDDEKRGYGDDQPLGDLPRLVTPPSGASAVVFPR